MAPSEYASFLDEERPLFVCSASAPPYHDQEDAHIMEHPGHLVVADDEVGDDHKAASAAANALLQRQLSVTRRMRVLTFFAAIGGFLSGYNTGVIAGALLPLKRVFQLTVEQEEAIVSATIISACIASSVVMGGTLNTYYGRRGTLLLAAAVFSLGGLLLLVAQNYAMILVGEILLGIGIGLESLTSPLYIAEVAKPSSRGRLVSAYALMMCMGQFFAGIMDGVYGAMLPDGWAWRFMFGTAMFPGIAMFVGFLGLPESPSWLMMQRQYPNLATDNDDPELQAQRILQSVRDTDQEVELELQSLRFTARNHNYNSSLSPMSSSRNDEKYSMWNSFQHMLQDMATRNALLVGCGLMILQQLCGVNGVLYYAASVYEMAGFAELTSIWLSAFTAFAQIIGLALAVLLIETAGRRVLVISSLVGIGLAALGLGYSFYAARIYSEPTILVDPFCAQQPALVWNGVTQNCWDCTAIPGCGFCGNACVRGTELGPLFMATMDPSATHSFACPDGTEDEWHYNVCENPYGYMSVVFMVLYLVVFGMGMAGLPWTVNSEIYPVRFRSLAVSISTGTNWLSNLLVSSTFLTINSPTVLTNYGSFYLYAALCFMGAFVMYCYLPETKGLSLQEIEQAFRQLGSPGHNGNPSTSPRVGEREPLLFRRRPYISHHDGTFGSATAARTHYPSKPQQCGDGTVDTCDSSDVSINEASQAS
jgi:MFS transporter, SP family, solute carrier family 2 (myo-inositol transporter), member 13